MGVTRTMFLKGPAKVAYDGLTFWTPDDITLEIQDGAQDQRSSMFGLVDRMVINPKVTCSFTPHAVAAAVAPTMAEVLAVLVPGIFLRGRYGESYIGAGAEKSLTIWSTNGDQAVVHNAVITAPPTLTFSADKPLFGAVTFTGITKATAGDIVLGANNSLYTVSTGVADPGGVFAGLMSYLQARYKGVWGAQAGFTEIWAEQGWAVSFNAQLRERTLQGLTVDYEVDSVEILARCVPTGPTMKQVLDLVAIGGATGASWGQGALMSAQQNTHSLTIVNPAGATVFTLNKPILRNPGFRFGLESLRVGELGWHSAMRMNAGEPVDLAAF